MSNEMIERVAKAIFAIDFPTGKLLWEKAQQDIYLKIAKAAIEAMKEPTQAMFDAGAYDLDMTLKQQWERMIEAALKE